MACPFRDVAPTSLNWRDPFKNCTPFQISLTVGLMDGRFLTLISKLLNCECASLWKCTGRLVIHCLDKNAPKDKTNLKSVLRYVHKLRMHTNSQASVCMKYCCQLTLTGGELVINPWMTMSWRARTIKSAEC